MTAKVASLSHGKNEAEWLPQCLQSIRNQTLKPAIVIYVDDGSTDNSMNIALQHADYAVPYMLRHEYNPLDFVHMATIYNKMFSVLEDCISKVHCDQPDYIWIGGCDAVYPPNYLEALVYEMEQNHKLAACSGIFRDEPCNANFARGLGRLYRADFWFKHVKRVPTVLDWETEPLKIARRLGYEVKSFPYIHFNGRATGERR
jgi:glycosyltransferase involved in cell wall biosynthesis